MTDRSEFMDRELFHAALTLAANLSSNVQCLKGLSADSLSEAYFKMLVDGEADDTLKRIFGAAAGVDDIQSEVPPEYIDELRSRA